MDNETHYEDVKYSGLFFSTDGGITFNKVKQFKNINYAQGTYITSDGTIFVSVGGNLYKSTDDGITFNLVLVGVYADFFAMGFNGTMIAGGYGDLYASTDGGKTFSKVNSSFKWCKLECGAIALDGTIYVGIQNTDMERHGNKIGLYASTDGGKTFNKVNSLDDENVIHITGIVINSNGTIFIVTANGLNGLYITTDGGKTFNKVPDFFSFIENLLTINNGIIYLDANGGYYKINLDNIILKLNKSDYFDNKFNSFVYNKEQKIDIKEQYIKNAELDHKNITLPLTDYTLESGNHTLIITLKDEYQKYAYLFGGKDGQITFNFWIKPVIANSDIKYSTNNDDTDLTDLSLGFISNTGNTNNCPIIETKSKDGTGNHNATLNSKFDDALIDYGKSYYQQGTVNNATNDFTATAAKQNVTKNLLIKADGIYHLHLVDMVGNSYDSYLELGESNWKLKGSFNDSELNRLKNKLKVTVNLTNQQQLAQATGWLAKYEKFTNDLFNKSLQANGKGFDEEIKKNLEKDFTWFLKPLTYELNNEPKFTDGIDKDKLNVEIIKAAEKELADDLAELPKNLNVEITNVVNKATLASYKTWINNYQDFINKNKEQWINDIVNVAARGFATNEQKHQIHDYIAN